MLVLTVLAFFAHQALRIEPATVALDRRRRGAARHPPVDLEKALAGIEWPTLFFFVALFVMVGALEATGAIGEVTYAVEDADRRRAHRGADGIIWVGGVGSASSTTSPSRRR